MKDYILETCVDSVESAMAAAEGGADRLELCSNLIIGGTTPGPWLFEEIRKRSDIRIHALIRPRFGDFCYTDAEFPEMGICILHDRSNGSGSLYTDPDQQHCNSIKCKEQPVLSDPDLCCVWYVPGDIPLYRIHGWNLQEPG